MLLQCYFPTVEQWGNIESTEEFTTFVFPIAFSSIPYKVIVTDSMKVESGDVYAIAWVITETTNLTGKIKCADNGGVGICQFLAIGK